MHLIQYKAVKANIISVTHDILQHSEYFYFIITSDFVVFVIFFCNFNVVFCWLGNKSFFPLLAINRDADAVCYVFQFNS